MSDASIAFAKWVGTTSMHENLNAWAPRHQYFTYVNEESIESVISPLPSRAWERTLNFLVLVDASSHKKSCTKTEASFRNDINSEQDMRDILAAMEDSTWKLILATDLKSTYILFFKDQMLASDAFMSFRAHRICIVSELVLEFEVGRKGSAEGCQKII